MAGNGIAGSSRLVAGTAGVAGALLVIVPRWVFPPCDTAGHGVAHCANTAVAEMTLGTVLLAFGLFAPATRRQAALLAEVGILCAALAVAWFLPDAIGYCPSPRMRCHYGMVPAIRFVAGLAATVLTLGVALRAGSGAPRGAPTP